ncbi:hypothetical protein F8S13_13330 [Chloroflexia bacterium SDU3-3]|nr:hypothetical protein F8S13_13330 [Chloroflexia bacterium SDU3-3]
MTHYAYRIMLLAAVLILSSSCSNTTQGGSSWKQAAPIAQPHTVTKIGDLELIMKGDNPKIVLYVTCLGSEVYYNVSVSIEEDISNFKSHQSIGNIDCNKSANDSNGIIISFDNIFHVGDTIEISLEGDNRRNNLKKDTTFYMVGTDNHLRLGAGSVWK